MTPGLEHESERFVKGLAARGYTPEEIASFGKVRYGLTLERVTELLGGAANAAPTVAESQPGPARKTACRRCGGEGCEYCYRGPTP